MDYGIEILLMSMVGYDKSNVFAKILKKELPASIVYEDDVILAFKTIEPMAKHHLLVIPKGEFVSYDDFVQNAARDTIVHFFKTIPVIANKLGIGDSYRLITNHGFTSGQRVFHFHFHLMSGFLNAQPDHA